MQAAFTVFLISLTVVVVATTGYWQYRKFLRETKSYERGLKMVPLLIHLPPISDDIEAGNRDERDVTEEAISQAQVMYNIIASTVTKGFKSRVYGQRHLTYEIIASKGLIHYYVVVPYALIDVVKQAVVAAYPTARLEEAEEHNMFSRVGKISGTIGGELTLKKQFAYPIATYQEAKRDAMRAILNALSSAGRDDGVGIQILMRPAPEGWTKNVVYAATNIRKNKGKSSSAASGGKQLLEALWKAPEQKDVKPEDKQLSSLEQATVDAMEEKTRHPGYEVLIRVIASSNTAVKSQMLMKNVVSAFALFDSPGKNGFKFTIAKNIEQFVTAFILRFFPQNIRTNILNSVELATLFHLPDQKNIPTSQVQRQASKQVDGPTQLLDEGFLMGYNVFRGVKKEIRLGTNDRRRHTYIIGQTGTGKSKLLENLALQDMLDGKGFAFIDPHGDSVEELLGMVPKERVEDVIYFNPSDMENPLGLNLFEFETQDQRDFLVQEAIAMLYRLYDPGHTGIIGPRYEHWFRNAALTIMSDPQGTSFIDIPQVFNDNDFAKEKLKYVTDQTVLDFWNKEMAQTSDYHKSEVLGWFVSKFGAFLSNEMMRNVIGQTKSGFNLREIMDNNKILLVNLSKGKTGELNSQLLGMIFVMKFQAAAMGRADTPESQRVDFALYVDEFQNFATDSFESILSEARKYRLNLILANQFVSQLTDKIREAIIGNVGTVVSGRIGTTDAELMAKKFTPVFDAEDLTKLPNYESVVVAQINGVPSAPFSMSFIPPLGKANPQLANALKRLSAAKYGRPRAEVEREIFARLRSGDIARENRRKTLLDHNDQRPGAPRVKETTTGSSFLDEWLAKRKQTTGAQTTAVSEPSEQQSPTANTVAALPVGARSAPVQAQPTVDGEVVSQTARAASPVAVLQPLTTTSPPQGLQSTIEPVVPRIQNVDMQKAQQDAFQFQAQVQTTEQTNLQHARQQGSGNQQTLTIPKNSDEVPSSDGSDEIYIDVRGNLHHRSQEAQSITAPEQVAQQDEANQGG